MRRIALALALLSSPVQAKERLPPGADALMGGWHAVKIADWDDGDTVIVTDARCTADCPRVVVRFAGIDAPETAHQSIKGRPLPAQPGGMEAAEAVKGLLSSARKVEIKPTGAVTYGRIVAHIRTVDLIGRKTDVDAWMVRQGWAWPYVAYPEGRAPELVRAWGKAMQEKAGVWSQKRPVPPWDWRARHLR